MTTTDSRVTDEMVSAAIKAHTENAYKRMFANPQSIPDYRADMRKTLEAALSAQAPSVAGGEPVAWQYRNIFLGEVGAWRNVDKKFAEDAKHDTDPSIEIRKLYAAPPSAKSAQLEDAVAWMNPDNGMVITPGEKLALNESYGSGDRYSVPLFPPNDDLIKANSHE